MASMAPVPISTAMVSPTMTPVERAVTRMLRISLRLLGLREGHADPRAPAFARRYVGLAAELHGKPADQRQAKAAADIGPDRAARPGPVVLDDELDHAGLVARLDADLGRRDAVEAAVERAAHRLGHDQPDGNGDVGADRHDRRTDVIARLRKHGRTPAHRDLTHQVADELLEVDERPARPFVEMPMQDRQREHTVLGVAAEPANARPPDLPALPLDPTA